MSSYLIISSWWKNLQVWNNSKEKRICLQCKNYVLLGGIIYIYTEFSLIFSGRGLFISLWTNENNQTSAWLVKGFLVWKWLN